MNPFAYVPSGGPLSRLSAASKALCLVLLSYAAMAMPFPWREAPGPGTALVAATMIAGLAACAAAWPAMRGIAVLAGVAGLARGVFPGDGRLFAPETLRDSAEYGIRLLAVFALGSLYFSSTRASELGEAATRLARRILRGRNGSGPARTEAGLASDPGILIGMTLRFLPRGFDRYHRTREAAAARGFAPRDFRLGSMAAVLERFAVASMRDALVASRAMEARCYDPGRTLPEGRFGLADSLAVAISGAVAVAAAIARSLA